MLNQKHKTDGFPWVTPGTRIIMTETRPQLDIKTGRVLSPNDINKGLDKYLPKRHVRVK